MPSAEYETRTDSVLAWKKAQKLGRFNPDAPSIEQQKVLASEREIEERGKLLPIRLHFPTGSTPTTTALVVSILKSKSSLEYGGMRQDSDKLLEQVVEAICFRHGSKRTAAYERP